VKRYLQLTPTPDSGVGPAHGENPFKFRFRLKEGGTIVDPPALRWQWRGSGAELPDWPFTTDMIRAVSPRVREVFERLRAPSDGIQWLPGTISTTDGGVHEYWVPHFIDQDAGVLDQTHTVWGPSGLPILWVLAHRQLLAHDILVVPGVSSTIVVSETVHSALRDIAATGITAKPARVVTSV